MAVDDILTLTDGTTSVDLLRGPVRVAQDGYAPAVAGRRAGELGGAGEWADVAEDMDLEVIATSAQSPGLAWSTAQRLLAQAERVARGSGEAAVTLRARPAGSRLAAGTVLAALALGGDAGRLHRSYFRLLEAGAVEASGLTVRRRGAWVDAAYDQVSATAAASQQIQTITWPTSHPVESPMALALTVGSTPLGIYMQPTSRILLAGSSAAYTIVDAEGWSNANFSSVSLAHARGGAVLELDGAAGLISAIGTITGFRRGEVYLLCYSTASVDATVTLHLSTALGITYSLTGASGQVRLSTVVPANQRARVLYLGRVDSAVDLTRAWLELGTTVSSGDVFVDTIVFHRDEGPLTGSLEWAGQTPFRSGSGQLNVATVDPAPLTGPAPLVYQADNADLWAPAGTLALYGDPYLQTRGSTVAVLPLLISRETGTFTYGEGMFVPRNSGDTAAVTFQATARRYRAHLSLE